MYPNVSQKNNPLFLYASVIFSSISIPKNESVTITLNQIHSNTGPIETVSFTKYDGTTTNNTSWYVTGSSTTKETDVIDVYGSGIFYVHEDYIRAIISTEISGAYTSYCLGPTVHITDNGFQIQIRNSNTTTNISSLVVTVRMLHVNRSLTLDESQ